MEENLQSLKNLIGTKAKEVNIGFTAILLLLYLVAPILSFSFGFSSAGVSAFKLFTEIGNLFKFAGHASGGASFGIVLFLLLIVVILAALVLAIIALVKDKPIGKLPIYICGAYLLSFLLLAIFAKMGSSFDFVGGWLPMIISGLWIYVIKVQNEYKAGK